jgi:hypothetical protein
MLRKAGLVSRRPANCAKASFLSNQQMQPLGDREATQNLNATAKTHVCVSESLTPRLQCNIIRAGTHNKKSTACAVEVAH